MNISLRIELILTGRKTSWNFKSLGKSFFESEEKIEFSSMEVTQKENTPNYISNFQISLVNCLICKKKY